MRCCQEGLSRGVFVGGCEGGKVERGVDPETTTQTGHGKAQREQPIRCDGGSREMGVLSTERRGGGHRAGEVQT